jgi:hypothetical protein
MTKFGRELSRSDALVERIKPMLADNSPEVVGATLSQLLAIFIAGHAPPLRDESLRLLVQCAEDLVPVMIDEMIADGRAPADWRGTKQ